ncbi:MAG: methylmalonyl-CoA mutase small subunit [Synergistaceae bacterium]|nr:methylmalonyl-CoA mutase small subunit [Synergistaceae bacterium]
MSDLEFDFNYSSYDEWKEAAVQALKGAPFEKKMFTPTYEGITLNPLYTVEDTKDLKAARTFPGLFALRGNSASGNLKHPWEIAQFVSESDPDELHKALVHELERGATTAAFNLDKNLANNIHKVLNGLLDKPLYIYAGASALETLKALENDARDLKGCIGADPLGVLLETGDLPKDLDKLFDDMAESIKWADAKHTPVKTILIRGSVAHNGGASAVQEAAYAMTAAIEILRSMLVRGIMIGEAARRMRFEFSQGANFFMEIAKIRAARIVWARIAESFGGDDDAKRCEIFAKTSSFTKTIFDPYVNMLRNTTEAFSAVVAGVEGLTVCNFDETLKPQSEFSRRVARNAQIMLQKEFNLLEPVDPAGGSWYIDRLTHEVALKIWEELQKIESQGGFLNSIKQGLIQDDIEQTLNARFKKLASRADRAVGTNMYPNMLEHSDINLNNKNKTYGDKVKPIKAHRWTEQFEELRLRTEDYKAKNNNDNLKIFLANMGPIPQHKARADFISGFMEVAAFEMLRNDGFKTVEECAEAAVNSNALISVICSTDATYPEIVPALTKLIKAKKPDMKVYLAGEPAAEFKASYDEAGIDGYISVKSNCLELLTEFQKLKGMF